MRRHQPNSPQRLFQGNELMRFMTMVCMFGVLMMLIVRSRDPNTWAWLAGGRETSHTQSAAGPDEGKNEDNQAAKTTETDRGAESNKSVPAGTAEEIKSEPGGPTDLDPEEVDAIQEEFQAVTDGKLSMQVGEMPAYHRLLRWAENQTLAEMVKRAKKNAVFTQFYQSPEKYRGQLYELQMTVHLVRNLDTKYNGKELFDMWGTTEESGQWLYNCVAIDLPKGMPIGRNIYENVTFIGYFFKLQGYQPAGAKPNAPALKAPLFVGRLIWHPVEKPKARGTDWFWGLLLLGGFLIFITIRWGLLLWGPRRRIYTPSTLQVTPGVHPVDEWLAGGQSNKAAEEEPPE